MKMKMKMKIIIIKIEIIFIIIYMCKTIIDFINKYCFCCNICIYLRYNRRIEVKRDSDTDSYSDITENILNIHDIYPNSMERE